MCEMHDTPRCNRTSGIYILTGFSEKTSLSWLIFHWVFSCVHLYRNETLVNLLHIALARRTKRFTLFCARSITCTRRFLLSMVMFIFSHCLLVYQCLKNGSDLYEKDNCIGDSISWDNVLKWRTVQKAKHYGPLPIIFQPLNTCYLFPPCTLSSGTKLMECNVGKTQKKLPRTKCLR